MRVQWDDDVYRFQPRLTEAGGYRIGRWINARNTAWGAFSVYLMIFFPVARLLLGVPVLSSIIYCSAAAAGAAYLTANILAPETHARGWIHIILAEARLAYRRLAYRTPTPARVSWAPKRADKNDTGDPKHVVPFKAH